VVEGTMTNKTPIEQLKKIEKRIGYSLPREYKNHVINKNVWLNKDEFHRILPPDLFHGARQIHLDDGVKDFFPLCEDPCGNQLGIKKGDKEHLYDWFHESGEFTPVGRITDVLSGREKPDLKFGGRMKKSAFWNGFEKKAISIDLLERAADKAMRQSINFSLLKKELPAVKKMNQEMRFRAEIKRRIKGAEGHGG